MCIYLMNSSNLSGLNSKLIYVSKLNCLLDCSNFIIQIIIEINVAGLENSLDVTEFWKRANNDKKAASEQNVIFLPIIKIFDVST